MSDTIGINEIPEIDLAGYDIDQKIVDLVPAAIAEKYKLIPLFKVGSTITIAVSDPKNILAVDEVRNATKLDISVVKASLKNIEGAITEYYGISGIIDEAIRVYGSERKETKVKAPDRDQSPIVKLVDALILQAVREKASDIHIEPEADHIRIRYRVDGVLQEENTFPSFMHGPVVSRIKVMAALDIAENRIPQDGRINISIDNKSIDLRISTFPSVYGEKVVMRILDKSSMLLSLSDLGFSEDNYKKISTAIHRPHGIVLVTGPTGSGKTTTLYACLQEINSSEINVVTVEDPIEYELDGITQSQVNVKAGLTFASALRSILRQDPDVIFIGEIRDVETAGISIQSALTGHMVLSSLHTNDSVGALARLADMGVESFLIASSVEAILAQRLVRLICPRCKKEIPVPEELKAKFPDLQVMYKGKGCKQCKGTGYKGRTCILEVLVVDDEVEKMISAKTDVGTIRRYALDHGMKTLYFDGIEKVRAGLTTYDEVVRVTELE